MICTHVAHKRHIKRKNRFLCLLCAHHHVPGVCTYLGVRTTLKFGIRRFQRRVPIVYTTKTRFCSSIYVNIAENRDFLLYAWKFPFFCLKSWFLPKTLSEPQGARNIRFWRLCHRWKGNCPYFSVFNIPVAPRVCAHMWHTKGTSLLFSKPSQNAVPAVCLVCVYNVPDVCAYLGTPMSVKYSIRAFQRILARLHTTKTRFCSSISVLKPLILSKYPQIPKIS